MIDTSYKVRFNDNAWMWFSHDESILHREYAPAVEADNYEQWYIHGVNITTDILEWIERLALPPWQQWTDIEKALFKLSFLS